jgi:glycosyltransferase involved in cell wall biosynthesis
MAKVKVVFVTTSMIVGGLEKVLVDVANGMDSSRYEVSVLLTKLPGPLADDFLGHVQVVSEFRRGLFGSFLGLFRMMSWMRRHRPDCVFTVGDGDKFFLGRLAAKSAKVPVILSGLHTTPGPEHVGRSILGRWNKHLMGLNSGVVTVTSHLKEYLSEVEGYPKEKTWVIANGTDTDRFTPGSPAPPSIWNELGLPDGTPLISIVAALRKEKRHDLFLEAAALTLKEMPTAHFLVVGGGPSLDALKDQARMAGIASSVHFLGPRHDIPNILRASYAACLSSTDVESAPICMLEALASGVPQVAPAIGGIPGIVADGETGFLYPAGDVAALSRHLVTLLGDAELHQKFRSASRQHALAYFSVIHMVRGHEDLIDALLENPDYRCIT